MNTPESTQPVLRLLRAFPDLFVAPFPALYAALAIAPPLLHHWGHDATAAFVFRIFRWACHQLPQRTLFVLGEPMAVCARCFALAAGLVLGSVLFARLPKLPRVPLWAIGVAMLPLGLDGFTQLFGFRESTNTLRVLTGGLLGAVTSLWAIASIRTAIDEQEET